MPFRRRLKLPDHRECLGIPKPLHVIGRSSLATGKFVVQQPLVDADTTMLGDQILGLELTRPSLEDVFLELTGRSLSESGDTDAR